MLLAPTLIFFRVHTRVLLTLFIALAIAVLCLITPARPPDSTLSQLTERTLAPAEPPLVRKHSGLPRTVIRLFVLLPNLLPHDR